MYSKNVEDEINFKAHFFIWDFPFLQENLNPEAPHCIEHQ
jgi:hypothetical protein